jgi:hypothetical protein
MKKHFKTTARFVAGILFLALGVVGALLPVLQGWIFFLLAALMFFPNHPRAERGLQKIEGRFPRFVGWLRRMGFGKIDDELANLDVTEWVHEHDPFHRHHEGPPGEEAVPQERKDPTDDDRERREAGG